ncbi:MAG: Gfo/Idh/MocA family oxidoreductase [Faecalibacterium sp.]
MERLRYAVIGTSKITTQYITAAKTTGQWEVCAVYSRTQQSGEAFAAQQDIPHVFCDMAAFAQSNLFEAVYIASPNVCHYEHCKWMLSHGKHVICEKPFASYPWQLEELFALAQQNNLVLVEAMMFMHQPAKQALAQAIAEIGKVEMVLFDNCRRSPQYDRLLGGATPNVFDPSLHTGSLMDMGVYCLHPALALFGRPTSFAAKANLLPLGTDACGVITLQYPDMVVELRYAKSVTSGMGSEILGEAGRISIGSILHSTDMVHYLPDGTTREIWGTATKTQLMANEAADFAHYILQGQDAAVQAEYQHCKQTSLLVCEYLEKIRREIGLGF